MKNILEFLSKYEELEIVKFEEDMIFNKPIEVFLTIILNPFLFRSGIVAMCSYVFIQMVFLSKRLFNM